jgi:tetratricopeptide (TPR) repeat protein
MLAAVKAYQQRPDDRLEREVSAIREACAGKGLDQMEAELVKLVGRYPKDAMAYHYLGEHYNRAQRFEEATATFRKGLSFRGDLAILHWDLALALQGLGQKRSAAESLERAVEYGLPANLRRHADMLLRVLRV